MNTPFPVKGFGISMTPDSSDDEVGRSGGGWLTRRRQALWRIDAEPGRYRLAIRPTGSRNVDFGVVEVFEDRDTFLDVPVRETD